MANVTHVHLIFKKKDYYFGSISAIFDYLEEEELGIKKNTLIHRLSGGVVITPKAIIRRSELLRCKKEKDIG